MVQQECGVESAIAEVNDLEVDGHDITRGDHEVLGRPVSMSEAVLFAMGAGDSGLEERAEGRVAMAGEDVVGIEAQLAKEFEVVESLAPGLAVEACRDHCALDAANGAGDGEACVTCHETGFPGGSIRGRGCHYVEKLGRVFKNDFGNGARRKDGMETAQGSCLGVDSCAVGEPLLGDLQLPERLFGDKARFGRFDEHHEVADTATEGSEMDSVDAERLFEVRDGVRIGEPHSPILARCEGIPPVLIWQTTPMLKWIAVVLPIAAVAQLPYTAAKEGAQYMHSFYIPPAPSTTPWAPAWSPDGKWIAVSMGGSIWRVDPKTGDATELTYSRKYHSSPAYSPDGKYLVYTADDDTRDINLEILNLETGQTRALTSGHEVYLDPVFSPDGTKLAYVTTRPNGHFNIYVRPIRDGHWAGEEMELTRDDEYPRERLYFGSWDCHIEPAWTRDSKQILFLSNRGTPLGSGNLWRMPVEPDGVDKAVPVLVEQTLYRTRPDVSPDGKRIVYSSTSGTADQYSNLYVLPVQGGMPYKLTFSAHDRFHPRWSPDGETIAHIANEGGLPQLWLLETYGGGLRKVTIRKRGYKRPTGKLHVRMTAPARIYLSASDGKFYAPYDAYARIGHTHHHTFHTKGEFTVEVPLGPVTLTAIHGFAHTPVTKTVTITEGKTAEVSIAIPALPFSLAGWYSGSTHVHMNYGGNLHNTPENLMMMAKAEDMNAIMNQVANKDNRILDYQYYAGPGEHPVSKGDPVTKLHIGQEYRPPFYGHVFFLGLKEHLISPFTTGYEGTGIESLYPSNTDMFRKAHEQGALTGYVHAYTGDADPLAGNLGVGKGFPVDAALGTTDCLEWSAASRAAFMVWSHARNLDLPVTPTGGEDSISSLHYTKLVGSVRTFASLDGPFTIPAWIDAVRKGRTYYSTGPLLDLRISGQRPGGTVKLPAGGGSLTIEAKFASLGPLSKAVLYRNGQVFKELPLSGTFRETVKETGSAWYSLYVEGPHYEYLDADYPQAITNAVRVYVGDQKIRNRASAEYFLRWIDKLQGMAEEWPWWRSQKERDHVFGQFEEARKVYRRLAQEDAAR